MQTLTRLVEHARVQPHKTALLHDGVACSYAELARRIAASQRFLQAQQLPACTVAVVVTAQLLDDWVLVFALRGLGLCTSAARSVVEIEALELPDVTIVHGCPASPGSALDPDILARWRCVQVPRAMLDAAHGADPHPVVLVSAPATGHIVRTSGTTGLQKKVMRDDATEDRCTTSLVSGYGYTAESVVYVVDFPLWTAGGWRWPLAVWEAGGTVIRQSPPDLMGPLMEHDCSHAMLTPDKLQGMLDALLHASPGAPYRNPALRVMVTGGSLSRALLARTQQMLGTPVYSALSSSEASLLGCTLLQGEDDLRWHRLFATRQVQVVDDDDRPVPSGVQGQLRVLIDDGLAGYLGDEAATRACFRDGYFYPGDLAVLGADGRLALCGRDIDVVNVLGNKVATGSVELALRERLQATAVCLLDLPGSAQEEALHLVIEIAQAPAQAALVAAIEAELGQTRPYPLHVHFMTRMPRNTMGKVQRPQLRQHLMQTLEGRLQAM
jgi:acyl-coenzyme A synthetase/AMP-(fatty) acid ligase